MGGSSHFIDMWQMVEDGPARRHGRWERAKGAERQLDKACDHHQLAEECRAPALLAHRLSHH